MVGIKLISLCLLHILSARNSLMGGPRTSEILRSH
jgi:hypothetical protein